jgi:predicted RNA-binding protein Jag
MTEETNTTSQAPVEGAVIGEGEDLRSALQDAGAKLEVDGSMLQYKLDLSHFKNAKSGINMGVDTVKLWAWPKDPALIEVSEAARAWMAELLERMDFGGKVAVRVDGNVVRLSVDTPKGGHLVGKRGVTIDAVRTLLDASLGAEHPDFVFKVDVADQRREREDDRGRGRDRDRDDRGRGRDRDDRGRGRGRDRDDRGRGRGRDRDDRGRGRDRDRDDRGRGRDRDDRGRGRGRDRDDRGRGRGRDRDDRGRGRDRDRDDRGRGRDRDDRGRERDDDESRKTRNRDVERLAHRLAKKVLSSGESELIRKEMNSYARRIVHMVVAEYEGLETESVGEGQHKQVRIVSTGGAPTEPSAD